MKERISYLISLVYGITGIDYKADYAPQYGGWCMYVLTEGRGQSAGDLGFFYRKNHKEMQAYLEGLINGLTHNNK